MVTKLPWYNSHRGHSSSVKAIENPRIHQAYIAMQAWKRVIYSDPNNLTANWIGPAVCNYTGVYCSKLPNDTNIQTVAGIDLNLGDIAGFLPDERGLLNDLVLKLSSAIVFANNFFGGTLPSITNSANTLEELPLINTSLKGCLPHEVGFLYMLRVLDVSNSKLVGLAHLEMLNLKHNMMSGIVPEGICVLPNLSNFTFSYNYFCEEQGICSNLTSKGIVSDDRRT
ncbi:hypothetical protein HAX54_050334 [Datura stramonium]|uniref:Leucine-rich repeat-containing N-terminal plant-type domain-containing protein n=1 Tax=Datura stramonium TaxID=4076 RepID=A0ABS8WNM2_DATST|nr:hypothetical protein [Datura stramonium]